MQTIQWHPKFLKFNLEDSGVLLIGEVLSYYFNYGTHPGLELIGSQYSPEQYFIQRGDYHQLSYFNHYSSRLAKQDIILDGKTASSQTAKYCQKKLTQPVTLLSCKHLKIINLSTAQSSYLEAWMALIQSEDVTRILENYNSPVTLILLDDFTHRAIDEVIAHCKFWMLIKITGERIWISPMVVNTEDQQVNWSLIKQRIDTNQPERQLVARLYPQQSTQVPFLQLAELEPELQLQLTQLLSKQVQKESDNLCLLIRESAQVSYHPFKKICIYSDTDFGRQIQQPVKLTSQTIKFDQDGGARCFTPEQTLTRLQALVSPITGVINYFAEIEPEKNNQLKIYCSRFSKTPTKRQLPKLSLADFSLACAGKGVSPTQSKVSALCEALERYAPVYQGNEPLFISPQSRLDGSSYSPHELTPYSEHQYHSFNQLGHNFYQSKREKKRYQNQSIHWLTSWSLTRQQKVYVPLACCFSNTPFNDEDYCLWHSNGCAAGNNLEEAILQALLELIERDAVAIWWYNKIQRPSFDLNRLPKQLITKVKQTLPDSMDFWVLDVTNNSQVSAMVAVAQDRLNKGFTIGLGCHLNPVLAAQRALTELCQLYPNRSANKSLFDFDKIAAEPHLYPDEQATAIERTLVYCNDISHNIMAIVERLSHLGLETLVLDYSRNDLPVKTVRVVVPGFCNIWPELGNNRLYQMPVKMNWITQSQIKNEQTINQQGLYI
ncbi:hypothetical protein CJF42_00390 [Pseudoalteromonas sp. NBT06-2]|uniref:YcaO-like family protein n=1 Tax=Pseudoalteromonas sp. NBT06-2 TaxID=2025950 RepID=UPI000BA676FC|nr:YcaO-like family protein [Pseudoalteromonas sp. NBT06-2]PAJ76392.1 hypothetical protein CJF42_00390 [Pseudoalteromonas sp. NBT06-2]